MKFRLGKMRFKGIITLLILLWSAATFGQSSILISKNNDQLSWYRFVEEIEQNHEIQFYFDRNVIPDFKVSIKKDLTPLKELLADNLKPFEIFVSIDHRGNIFLTKQNYVITDLPLDFFRIKSIDQSSLITDTLADNTNEVFLKTTEEYFAQTFVIGTSEKGANKNRMSISGYIKNAETREPIIGATIIQSDIGTGVAANLEGYFRMDIAKGKHILTINSVSTTERKIEVNVLSDDTIDIFLEKEVFLLDDVIISAQKYSRVKGTEMGIEKIQMIMIKKTPLVFGEHDILKIALLLPGIQSVGEGSSGFNVRGSPTDQNIFYINNAPIYNTSHAAGFFSAFNSDAISEFSLYKNYIPINYGGRLASVFDIKPKSGSMTKTKVNGGVGLITGRILAEGPILADKSSFMVALRSTYSNWALKMVDDVEISDSKINFADLITNFSFQLNENNRLNIFSYASNDEMNLATKTKYDYQNYAASAIWKHYFKAQNNFELSLAHSTYTFTEENTEVLSFAYKHLNKIMHSEISANFNLIPHENHNLILGANSVLHNIDRGNPTPLNGESRFLPITLGTEKGLESGLYISDEWKISSKISMNGGIRYNLYKYLGPQTVNKYHEGFPKSEETIYETQSFKNNESIKTFQGFDTRFVTNYLVNSDLSFKIAYNRLHQYMYMLSNTVAIAPNYKWKLVDYNTKPMISDQFSAGVYANFPARRIELSLEGYYKKIQNLVELKNGTSIFLNEFVEQSTLQGELDAYGFEIMLKKPYGSVTGWINYTYSNTSVLVNSKFREDQINLGNSFPSNYDKPHAVNLVLSRNFSKRFNMTANFVYSTGRPITIPESLYYLNGVKYLNYSKRNEHRIPDYIRLDLSFNLEGNLKKHKISHGHWSFSIYNLLGRKNAYSVYFVNEDDQIKGYKFSVFGAPIYSLSYNFKLGNYDN